MKGFKGNKKGTSKAFYLNDKKEFARSYRIVVAGTPC